MQLRKHSLLTYHGFPAWPPVWVAVSSGTAIAGEVGSLKRVRLHPDRPRCVFLTIEDNGVQFTGCLIVEFQFAAYALEDLLKHHIGVSIRSIGDLELADEFGVPDILRTIPQVAHFKLNSRF
jgi:hypothetical protein